MKWNDFYGTEYSTSMPRIPFDTIHADRLKQAGLITEEEYKNVATN